MSDDIRKLRYNCFLALHNDARHFQKTTYRKNHFVKYYFSGAYAAPSTLLFLAI